ncbi:lysophospholipid acyltransferase family protein [Bacteroidota bacterium]
MLTILKLFLIAIHGFFWCTVTLLTLPFDRNFVFYFKVSKWFSSGILKISGIKLNITGLENLSAEKTYVFVPNHSSQYDITSLQYSIPNRMSMIFKKELARIPIFGWTLYLGPYIVIDRNSFSKAMESIEEAKERMEKQNISVVVFAEGTRSKTGEIQSFKRGAFRLATKVGYPIIPVSISGSNKIMPKGTFKISPGTIDIHFDKPIPSEGVESRSGEIELMNRVREVVVQNHKLY